MAVSGMLQSREAFRFLQILIVALLGSALLYFTFQFVDHYQMVRQWEQPWITIYLTMVAVGGLLVIGVVGYVVVKLWYRSRYQILRKRQRDRSPSQLPRSDQKREIEENLNEIKNLQADAKDQQFKLELDPLVREFIEKKKNGTLEIVAFGTVSSGKSSLLNAVAGRDVFRTDIRGGTTIRRNEIPWSGADCITLVDTPGFSEIEGQQRQQIAASAAKGADLVLVVVDGPLRQSEFQLLEILNGMEKRMLVCLNKKDLFGENDRDLLVQQISKQVDGLVNPRDVVAVRSCSTQQIRRRVLADGSEMIETVELSADIEPLAERMLTIIGGEGQSLLMANLLLRSRGLVDEARRKVQDSLDRQAWQIVDRYTWGVAGAAALCPFPAVDLMVGCAVSSKMVVDLAAVYRQDIDQDSAVKLLSELGKHLVGMLGGVTATAAVGSLLKGVPGAGWAAGGVLQGISQALITRWIGSVFVDYFGNAMCAPEGGLAGLAQRQWNQMTSVNQLRRLIGVARSQLTEDNDGA